MSIRIETGKCYRTRCGEKVGPMHNHPDDPFIMWDGTHEGACFMDGARHKDAISPDDLIAEWADPCPLGMHDRGADDNCTICGATPEQINDQAREQMPLTDDAAEDQDVLFNRAFDAAEANAAATLTDERKTTHGNWTDQAVVGVMLDQAVQDSTGYASLAPFQRKAVDMILVKISRIVSGDPSHADHWDDVAGYAYLGKSGHKPA